MSNTDSGVWKLLIYPLAIIFVIGIILNLVITPFLDNGIYPSGVNQSNVDYLRNITENGIPFEIHVPLLLLTLDWVAVAPSPIGFLPQFLRNFIVDQILILTYIPYQIYYPLIILFSVAIIYAVVHIIQGFIP